jgi:CRP-like cAMP-binding protein
MVALEKILTPKIRAFARFTLLQRIAMLKKIRYATFPTGSTILKEGHLPFSFYIIISGQVDVVNSYSTY